MTTVYGVSDDTVIIKSPDFGDKEISCPNKEVVLRFADGTVVRVGYQKPSIAVWYIMILTHGSAPHQLNICSSPHARIYSDILVIQSSVQSIEVL